MAKSQSANDPVPMEAPAYQALWVITDPWSWKSFDPGNGHVIRLAPKPAGRRSAAPAGETDTPRIALSPGPLTFVDERSTMTIMVRSTAEWTLTEAARILDAPQHRLIYLCEKGVVLPDFQDADGRGSSRRFSARNMLEFAVALRLLSLGIPATVSGSVTYVLRGFEQAVAQRVAGFHLPESLVAAGAPLLRVVIGDDQRLYFTLESPGSEVMALGGVSLEKLTDPGERREASSRALGGDMRDVGQGLHAKVDVNVTAIAKGLALGG